MWNNVEQTVHSSGAGSGFIPSIHPVLQRCIDVGWKYHTVGVHVRRHHGKRALRHDQNAGSGHVCPCNQHVVIVINVFIQVHCHTTLPVTVIIFGRPVVVVKSRYVLGWTPHVKIELIRWNDVRDFLRVFDLCSVDWDYALLWQSGALSAELPIDCTTKGGISFGNPCLWFLGWP